MIEKRFGNLTVVGRTKPRPKWNNRYWCVCDCGQEETVRIAQLKSWTVTACRHCRTARL